ncbi:MAG: hypothetical protein AAGF15_02975 [Pseudomonadota bacterium]
MKRLDRVIGHDNALDQFSRSVGAGRLHHGWIIGGQRGIGKMTLACQIAKAVIANAPDADTATNLFGEPEPWTAILEDDHPIHNRVRQGAVAELKIITPGFNEKTKKHKSEIGVDEIRSLLSLYQLTSAEGNWRVTIIDSADAMTRQAANALLKILEEPPARSLLILIAHAPGRLLPTLRSRCMTLNLSSLDDHAMDMVMTLHAEAEGEGHELPAGWQENWREVSGLAKGAPGAVFDYLEKGAADILSSFRSVCEQPPNGVIDTTDQLISQFGTGSDAQTRFALFVELLQDACLQTVRTHAGSREAQGSSQLDPLWALWEKARHEQNSVPALNLDPAEAARGLLIEWVKCQTRLSHFQP